MKNAGYERPLYLLSLDDLGPFHPQVLGRNGALSPEPTVQIAAGKQVIYDGFIAAVDAGLPKANAGIVVDERFGTAILRDAAARGYTVACPVEKSGQHEFDFEYGEDFARHLEAFQPAFCRALVRYNPRGNRALNERQAQRLRRLSRYLQKQGRIKFMVELFVPAEKFLLELLQGNLKAYDLWLRPQLTVEAIEQLQDAEVEPDVWSIEGLARREDCESIVAATRRLGRTNVVCIVGGRDADETMVRKWLTVAARVPGFIGFALGRTSHREPLLAWWAKELTRQDVVSWIAAQYRHFIDTFEGTEANHAA